MITHFWPGTLRGTHWPDSGYRHDTPHRITVLAQDHPVTRGVERDTTRAERGKGTPSPRGAHQRLLASRTDQHLGP